MAKVDNIIDHIIRWETGTFRKTNESDVALYTRAAAKGVSYTEGDAGGYTFVGITLDTYRSYMGTSVTPDDLSAMSFVTWKSILKRVFWDRWHADEINNQSIANALVDWLWTSGTWGIKKPQAALGLRADGIVGPLTLAAVNDEDTRTTFYTIKAAHIAYIDNLCINRPTQEKFRDGWINRINSIEYEQ